MKNFLSLKGKSGFPDHLWGLNNKIIILSFKTKNPAMTRMSIPKVRSPAILTGLPERIALN
jgi:hypothetical protein